MTYPIEGSLDDVQDICDIYGENGLDRCFHKETKSRNVEYSYRESIKEFLDEDKIGEYSCKIKSILECIRESDGIVFIYSNWIKSGVIPLVLALEQNGYRKYNQGPILKSINKREPISYDGIIQSEYDKGKKFSQASYMVIAGGQENLSNNLSDELRVVSSGENKNGSLIKVVIGSKVASEGLDFKCVRSIHVLEPWHNINRLEQVIGRGIRNCSHKDLSPEERNATIYLHNAYLNHTQETIDTYLYRYSEKKAKQIGEIEVILKKGAIDKFLFQNLNRLTEDDVESFEVKPAYRDWESSYRESETYMFSPEDKPYSRVCSFQPDCDYLEDELPMKEEDSWNTDTFQIELSQGFIDVYKKRISLLLRENGSIRITDLKPMIEVYQVVHDVFLDGALDQLINERDPLFGPMGERGCAILNDGHLIFQPDFSTDELLPYYYRFNRGSLVQKVPTMKTIASRETEIKATDIIYTMDEQCEVLRSVKKYALDPNESDMFEIFKVPLSIQWGYIIDRLSFDQRKVIFAIASSLFIGDTTIDDFVDDLRVLVTCIGEYGKRFFLYYDRNSDQFSYEGGTKKTFYGYLLYHARNKKMYSFSYTNKNVSLTNAIDQMQVDDQIRRYKNLVTFTGVSWGYMVYSNRYKRYQNGMVCKIVDKGGNPRKSYPGAIFRDTGGHDETGILLLNPYAFIEREFPEIIEIPEEVKRKELKDVNSRVQYAVVIECALRINNRFLSQEMVYLRYS